MNAREIGTRLAIFGAIALGTASHSAPKALGESRTITGDNSLTLDLAFHSFPFTSASQEPHQNQRTFERAVLKPGSVELELNEWCYAGQSELHAVKLTKVEEAMKQRGLEPSGFSLTYWHPNGDMSIGLGNGQYSHFFSLPLGFEGGSADKQKAQALRDAVRTSVLNFCRSVTQTDPAYGMPIYPFVRGFAYSPVTVEPLDAPVREDYRDYFGFGTTGGDFTQGHQILLPTSIKK